MFVRVIHGGYKIIFSKSTNSRKKIIQIRIWESENGSIGIHNIMALEEG